MNAGLEIRDRGQRTVIARHGANHSAFTCSFSLELVRTSGHLDRRGGIPFRGATADAAAERRTLAALDRLGHAHDNRIALRYERLRYSRTTSYDGEPPRHGETDVWALTGSITTENGRELPIGWSGRGPDPLESELFHGRIARLADALARAEPATPGAPPVLLSTQAAAVLLHEAVGHFAEASADIPGGLSHRLGARLGSDMLTVTDDPGGETGCARYATDDEAVDAIGATDLVRDGVLIAQLHSRASASEARTLPTANARAALWCRPLPRMSNLVCAAGKDSSAVLADRLWRGLLVHHLSYGHGIGRDVSAHVLLAEHIECGRRTGRYVTGLRVRTCNDVFTRAIGFGDRAETNPNGLCGKAGQILFDVGTTAPEIALSSLELVA
ncbi:hypothetical protein EQZ23_11860 [Sphingomonas sp. UV9]|nr:hypothetical protein EQZ23_11860 [Sphingomonas sp. UV9]